MVCEVIFFVEFGLGFCSLGGDWYIFVLMGIIVGFLVFFKSSGFIRFGVVCI